MTRPLLELVETAAALVSPTHDVPDWAFDLIGRSTAPWQVGADGFYERVLEGDGHALISVCVPAAQDLTAHDFEAATLTAYRCLGMNLGKLDERAQPIRLWNFIPGILEPLGALRHRYMVFNAGRFAAFAEHFGAGCFGSRLATASGVGHGGRDLLIHCLTARTPGQPVENPRQIAAYRYSRRYGPKPPCFARATRWSKDAQEDWLLVGGTASVRGEDSLYEGDLEAQLDETLHNLATLVGAALGHDSRDLADDQLLATFRDLRIYLVKPDDRDRVESVLGRRLGAAQFEFLTSELCRPELLVEIEGVASLPALRNGHDHG